MATVFFRLDYIELSNIKLREAKWENAIVVLTLL